MIIYRSNPKFWHHRIIELIQIRECQLRGEEHDMNWYELMRQFAEEELENER